MYHEGYRALRKSKAGRHVEFYIVMTSVISPVRLFWTSPARLSKGPHRSVEMMSYTAALSTPSLGILAHVGRSVDYVSWIVRNTHGWRPRRLRADTAIVVDPSAKKKEKRDTDTREVARPKQTSRLHIPHPTHFISARWHDPHASQIFTALHLQAV